MQQHSIRVEILGDQSEYQLFEFSSFLYSINKMSLFSKKEQKKQPTQYLEFDSLASKKYIYDSKKANEQSVKQEQYINDLRKAYDQQRLEIEPIFQKVELLQVERKQLMDEVEQYKMSQMEILKKYEGEYQDKERLAKECQKYKQQILALQKMQMPQEFQEKKCQELKESLFNTIKDIMNDFLESYNDQIGYDNDDSVSASLFHDLLQQIDDSILMFVENLPAQSSRQYQSDEVQHLKDQIEKTLQIVANLQSENQDLVASLESEKQLKDKINNQKNTQQQLVSQLQNQIEQIVNEKKAIDQQHQEIQIKYQDLSKEFQKLNSVKEDEKEKLKGELITLVNELQKEIQKVQQENSRLLQQIEEKNAEITNKTEAFNNKVRDLETKLNHEELKYEQKSKEFLRNERELNQSKSEAAKLFENNNILQQQLDAFKEKRKQEKEIFDDQKEKYKQMKLQLQKQEQEYEAKINQLEEQIQLLQQKTESTVPSDLSNNPEIIMEKELQISKLEQSIIELNQKNNELKQKLTQNKIEINDLNHELEQQKVTNQQHLDKRAFALSELNRLEQQNQLLKQKNNDQNQIIKQLQLENQQISQMVKSSKQQPIANMQKQLLNQSISKTPMVEANYLDSSMVSDAESQTSKQSKPPSMLMKGLNYFKPTPQTIQNAQQENQEIKIAATMIHKQTDELKQNLEQLYKCFLSTVLLGQNNEEGKFLKFEREINECLKKTQDLNDNIEDFLIL
ncbi:unnamed protein product (macronuclear) [Paramecium tetraurelia]|uniref:Uncharacterized protein n=1 Tax=Paramecium tetraurelia TaxID=5888 RepID=A0CXE9_PARTE|nr:uncharacterized protein GSPATT00011098001 [Paramecium tetraurelia]CAK75466.1 unnamed protein product [Paramecium tetraurelia]|eukprot:XP_001442863.1 hypothetical protein (macronuclear) [Paramecium tetraurelia strain d4-2]